jgi:hypothetical protein
MVFVYYFSIKKCLVAELDQFGSTNQKMTVTQDEKNCLKNTPLSQETYLSLTECNVPIPVLVGQIHFDHLAHSLYFLIGLSSNYRSLNIFGAIDIAVEI